MTSLIRSSITGLYHPKRSFHSLGSLSTPTIDRILNADKSGFLPTDSSLINSSRSGSNVDLTESSALDRSILETQIKRTISCNETLEATVKRIRTESQNSLEDLTRKNEALERSLHQSRIKISELEHQLDKAKQPVITASDIKTPTSIYEQQIKTLEHDKLELKLQLQHEQHLHTKETTQLQQTINDLKHQLTESNNKLKLTQFEQEKFQNLNKNLSHQLQQQTIQLEQCQKRIIELELILSTLNSSNVVNQTLLTDIKQSQEIRRENEQLKKQIELLKLKCNERTVQEEEIRMLRQQVRQSDDYRAIIAKKDAEIHKLRGQLN